MTESRPSTTVEQLTETTTYDDFVELLKPHIEPEAETILGTDYVNYVALALLKACNSIGLEDVMYCQDLKNLFSLEDSPLPTKAMLLILQVGLSSKIMINPIPAYYVFYNERTVQILKKIHQSIEE